jgi:hypothetical protein
MNIRWYSMNRNQTVDEHESVGLDEALRIVDRYLARAGDQFKSAEEAISETMFGFCRSNSEFIEICMNGPAQIWYKFEVPNSNASWFRKLFKGAFQHEEKLHSREELVQKVAEFFTTPTQEIMQRLQNR